MSLKRERLQKINVLLLLNLWFSSSSTRTISGVSAFSRWCTSSCTGCLQSLVSDGYLSSIVVTIDAVTIDAKSNIKFSKRDWLLRKRALSLNTLLTVRPKVISKLFHFFGSLLIETQKSFVLFKTHRKKYFCNLDNKKNF